MRALIVGASGHLGAHLARALLTRGIPTRAFVRSSSRTEGLKGLELEIFTGDIRDRASLQHALVGCDHVYHLASPIGFDPEAGNIILDGTRILLEEASQMRVERVVLTSSTVAVGYSNSPSVVLDEGTSRQSFATPYHAAKWLAEQRALEFGRTNGLPIVVVNPSSIVGSLDFRVTPSNAPIKRCFERGLPFAFKGGITIVHAADVALGHILAMDQGRPGERYILGGDRLTISAFFSLISRICHKPEPVFVAPNWVMRTAGLIFSVAKLMGYHSIPFSFGQIHNIVGQYAWYSSEKARANLGYAWRPAEEAVADYVRWIENAGV